MGFLEKATTIITGKNSIERRQEQEANKIIRAKALAAQYQEREQQAIRLAKEKEKALYDQKIRTIKDKYKPKNNNFFNYGTPFGQPRFDKMVRQQNKGKKDYRIREPVMPGRVDLLGFGNNNPGKYKVI